MKFNSRIDKNSYFSDLTSLRTYIHSLEENPKPDNKNLFNPDFTSDYRKEEETFFKHIYNKIARKLGFQVEYFWIIKLWATLTEKLTKEREKNNYEGDFVLKIKPPVNTRFVIWGDLNGAIHSLMRDLDELNKQKIISEDLIISNGNYFIFNGNLIGFSPYSVEILIVVMQLMKNNPEKVIYIRGKHEYKQEWHDNSLKQELKERASELSNEKIPFNSLINRFFNTLPLAIYLQSDNEYVRVSNIEDRDIKLDKIVFINNSELEILNLKKKSQQQNSEQAISVQAIIKNLDRAWNYKPSDGLQLLIPIKGITAWTILSSPTQIYQKLFSFYNDAFVFLNISENLYKWSIILNYQDIREKKGFKSKEYNLLTGLEIGKHERKKIELLTSIPIVLGCTLDLSESSRALGLRLRQGIMLGINRENLSGGIAGRLIKIVFLDDKYSPYLAKKNVDDFLKNYKTDIVISPLGTPTLEAYLPLIKSKQILVLFPYTGANIYRNPKINYIINFRTSYSKEAKALVDHAVKTLQRYRFAIFYQDDSYGRACLAGAGKALESYSGVQAIEIPYTRNNPNIGGASERIINFGPDVLLLFSTYAPSVALVDSLGLSFLANKVFMGVSFLTDTFRNFLHERGLGFIISRVVPPLNTDIAIINEYKEDMKKEYRNWSPLTMDSLEGYINMRLFCDIARNIKAPLSKEKIVEHLCSIKNYDFKGLILNFDSNTHELYKNVWIDTGQEEWILAQQD